MNGLTPTQQERLNRLKLLVTYRVDEYSEQTEDLSDSDINFGDLDAELNDAARKVLTSVHREEAFRAAIKADQYVGGVVDSSRDCVTVPLPEDYLRFVQLKISGYKTPVNGLIPDNSSAYRLQQHSLHRGTNEKPKGFRVPYFDSTYTAGVVPEGVMLCTIKTAPANSEYIGVGDKLTFNGDLYPDEGSPLTNVESTVKDADDPDYIWVQAESDVQAPWYTAGNVLEANNGSWELVVKYVAGDTYTRPSHKDAIEVYPKSEGVVEQFVYVPELKSYDMPKSLEDPLVWYATYRMLLINERFEGAQLAENEFVKSLSFINTGRKGEENEQSR